MSSITLFTQLIILVTGVLCLFVAVKLGKRQLSDRGEHLAWRAFRIWWFALGLNIMLSSFNTWLALNTTPDLTFHIAIFLISTLTLCSALWGLLFYLTYLFTGDAKWALPLGFFYGLVFTSVASYLLFVLRPNGVLIEDGSAILQYSSEAPELTVTIIALFILLPQILAALAYFSLYFRLNDLGQRYRVLLVSLSILIWFCSPFIALAFGVAENPWWSVVSRLVGMIAIIIIYWAYYPPKFLQRRIGIASI
jgi:hypothetical protein